MKTASMLVNPVAYSNAYKKGKEDAENGKAYSNIYPKNSEEFDGYFSGYHENIYKK